MRQLLLLRHAKSALDDPSQSDHARPLNARGKAAAASIRLAMLELGLVPDVVLVSSARRTRQTLEGLEPWDERPIIEPLNELYLATAPQLLGVIHGVTETVRSLLVIGHNPGLHDLAMYLAGARAMLSDDADTRRLAAGFPPGALAEFTIARSWHDLGEGGGYLNRFFSPRDLPEMAN